MEQLEENLQPIKNVESCIEAVVFAAGYPVPYHKLADVTGLGLREIRTLVSHIAEKYAADEHGIMLLTFEDSCQFCTRSNMALTSGKRSVSAVAAIFPPPLWRFWPLLPIISPLPAPLWTRCAAWTATMP